MAGSLERERRPIENPSRRKEVPQFSVIERICRGIEVVEMAARERKYHVTWEKDDWPTHTWFDTSQQVLNQHERVIEKYLGTEIPLAAGQLFRIPGETQKMGEINGRLSILGRRYLMPLSFQKSDELKKEIAGIVQEIGQVTNEYKRSAQDHLQSALSVPGRGRQVDGVLEANLAILARNRECLSIVQGTLARFRRVSRKREEWEGIIERSFKEMVSDLVTLEGGVDDRKREQIARHISGTRYGVFVRLQSISGPEYWERIKTREVQNLARFGDFLREGNEQRAKRILRQVILKLERVVQQKQERQKTKVEK